METTGRAGWKKHLQIRPFRYKGRGGGQGGSSHCVVPSGRARDDKEVQIIAEMAGTNYQHGDSEVGEKRRLTEIGNGRNGALEGPQRQRAEWEKRRRYEGGGGRDSRGMGFANRGRQGRGHRGGRNGAGGRRGSYVNDPEDRLPVHREQNTSPRNVIPSSRSQRRIVSLKEYRGLKEKLKMCIKDRDILKKVVKKHKEEQQRLIETHNSQKDTVSELQRQIQILKGDMEELKKENQELRLSLERWNNKPNVTEEKLQSDKTLLDDSDRKQLFFNLLTQRVTVCRSANPLCMNAKSTKQPKKGSTPTYDVEYDKVAESVLTFEPKTLGWKVFHWYGRLPEIKFQIRHGGRKRRERGMDLGGLTSHFYTSFFNELLELEISADGNRLGRILEGNKKRLFLEENSLQHSVLPSRCENRKLSHLEELAYRNVGRFLFICIVNGRRIPQKWLSGFMLDYLLYKEPKDVMKKHEKTKEELLEDAKNFKLSNHEVFHKVVLRIQQRRDTPLALINKLRKKFQLKEVKGAESLTPEQTTRELGKMMQEYFIDTRKRPMELIRKGFGMDGIKDNEGGVLSINTLIKEVLKTRECQLEALALPPVNEHTRKKITDALRLEDGAQSEIGYCLLKWLKEIIMDMQLSEVHDFLIFVTGELEVPDVLPVSLECKANIIVSTCAAVRKLKIPPEVYSKENLKEKLNTSIVNGQDAYGMFALE